MENKLSNKNKNASQNSSESMYKLNNHYKRMRIAKRIVSHIVLIMFALFAVFPIYYVVITSLNSIGSLAQASLGDLIPSSHLTLSNYIGIIYHHLALRHFQNF